MTPAKVRAEIAVVKAQIAESGGAASKPADGTNASRFR